MTRALSLVAKGVVIAICAAVAAWAYLVALTLYQGNGAGGAAWITGEASRASFLVALLGTFAVGLPIPLFTFRFSGKHLAQSFTSLAMVAVLAGIMLLLASFVLADEAGVIARVGEVSIRAADLEAEAHRRRERGRIYLQTAP